MNCTDPDREIEKAAASARAADLEAMWEAITSELDDDIRRTLMSFTDPTIQPDPDALALIRDVMHEIEQEAP